MFYLREVQLYKFILALEDEQIIIIESSRGSFAQPEIWRPGLSQDLPVSYFGFILKEDLKNRGVQGF